MYRGDSIKIYNDMSCQRVSNRRATASYRLEIWEEARDADGVCSSSAAVRGVLVLPRILQWGHSRAKISTIGQVMVAYGIYQ